MFLFQAMSKITALKKLSTNGIALFGGNTANSSKYSYSSNTSTYGPKVSSLAPNMWTTEDTACNGNSLVGIFSGGSIFNNVSSSHSSKYIYATDTVIPGTLLNPGAWGYATASNASVGYFCGFNGGGGTVLVTNKYYYGTDTVLPGTAIQMTGWGFSGVGNEFTGIFGGTAYHTGGITYIYDYATDFITVGTALIITNGGQYGYGACTAGDKNVGIFAGGIAALTSIASSATNKYTYANNTSINSINLDRSRYLDGGTSNPSYGVFSGSAIVNSSYISRYYFSSDTTDIGGSLVESYTYVAACSSNPGNFNSDVGAMLSNITINNGITPYGSTLIAQSVITNALNKILVSVPGSTISGNTITYPNNHGSTSMSIRTGQATIPQYTYSTAWHWSNYVPDTWRTVISNGFSLASAKAQHILDTPTVLEACPTPGYSGGIVFDSDSWGSNLGPYNPDNSGFKEYKYPQSPYSYWLATNATVSQVNVTPYYIDTITQ